MPMDGRYDARSHGGGAVMYRMYGMTQGAMEGGAAMCEMYGQIFAPALSSYPTSMWVKASSDECRKCRCLSSRPAGEILSC